MSSTCSFTVVYQGHFWANTEQMGYVIAALTSAPMSRVIGAKGEGLLTPREEQVVNLVAEGIGNREIAQQLGIKENTVKKSLLRVYDKLGVSNRVELVLYALSHRGTDVSILETEPHLDSPSRSLPMGGLDPTQVGLPAKGCVYIPKEA